MTKTNDISKQIKLLTAQKNEIDRKLRTLENARMRRATAALHVSREAKGQKVVKVELVKTGDQILRDGGYRTVIGREAYQGKVFLTYRVRGPNCSSRGFDRGTNITIKA